MRKPCDAFTLLALLVGLIGVRTTAERRVFRVPETTARGERIGTVADWLRQHDGRPFHVVFPDASSEAEKLLEVNERTGDVILRGALDFEKKKELRVVLLPAAATASFDDANNAAAAAEADAESLLIAVEVLDENDNAPQFPVGRIKLVISESTRLNTEFALPYARDADSGVNGVQTYRIIGGGNPNNTFRLSSHLFNRLLYVDLIVSGRLDREHRDRYDLRIEAADGGHPPKTASLEVSIHVADANDNAPVFSQRRYTARIPNSVSVGVPVLKVTASDADAGDNGRIDYTFVTNERDESGDSAVVSGPFKIHPETGTILVDAPLPTDFNGSVSIAYELVVRASDRGGGASRRLSSTARVHVVVEATARIAADSKPTLSVMWLTENGAPSVAENAPIGRVIARILISGGDAAAIDLKPKSLTLSCSSSSPDRGRSGAAALPLCLQETDSSRVYLLIICGVLDRESRADYRLSLMLRASGGEVLFDHPVQLDVTDVNDNAPTWNRTDFHLVWRWHRRRKSGAAAGGRGLAENVWRLVADDPDERENGRVRYTLQGTTAFRIDAELGVLSMTDDFDCAAAASQSSTRTHHFQVLAEDNGRPPLTSIADVRVDVVDVDARPPRFQRSLYEAHVREDADASRTCLLQVLADDFGCRNEERPLRYSIVAGNERRQFRMESSSGELCLATSLDYEANRLHQLVIAAQNQDDKTSTTLVNVWVEDVDDNAPHFRPLHYHLTVQTTYRDPDATGGGTAPRLALPPSPPPDAAILSVHASDSDASSAFNTLRYRFVADDGTIAATHFAVDAASGALFATEPLQLAHQHQQSISVRVMAEDAAGTRSAEPAVVHVQLVEEGSACAAFTRRIYDFTIAEDLLPGIAVGRVELAAGGGGDAPPDLDNFRLQLLRDESSPSSTTAAGFAQLFELSDDASSGEWGTLVYAAEWSDVTGGGGSGGRPDVILLNVQVENKLSQCRNYTQIRVHLRDVNDQPPRFQLDHVDVHLAEDFPLHQPFFVVHASDVDRGENGRVAYEYVDGIPPCPLTVNATGGHLALAAPLDFERVDAYRLRVRARDHGVPPRSATITVDLHVHDVNDNPPIFEKSLYNVDVAEDAELMHHFLAVHATDADANENGAVRYAILDETAVQRFGINSASGELFLRQALDREHLAYHSFVVVAMDEGEPPLSSNTTVHVRVLDVNDNTPNCSGVQVLYVRAADVLEDSDTLSTPIGRLNAVDPDEGANGTVTYRMQQQDEWFEVRSNAPRRPRSAVCTFSVRVLYGDDDFGDAPALSAVHILGEPPPRVLYITDNADLDAAELLRLNVSGVARWRLDGADVDALLQWNASDGVLRLRQASSPELRQRLPYSFRILLTDAANRTLRQSFTLRRKEPSAIAAQQLAPKSRRRLVVDTTLSARSPIGVKVLDASTARTDRGSPPRKSYFKLADVAKEADGLFELDEWSGELFLADPRRIGQLVEEEGRLVGEQQSDEALAVFGATILEYSLDVDYYGAPQHLDFVANLSSFADVAVVDEVTMAPPRFVAPLTRWRVTETATVGSVVGRVALTDRRGVNRRYRFSLTEELSRGGYFRVNATSGEVYLQRPIDYAVTPQHLLVVEAEAYATAASALVVLKPLRVAAGTAFAARVRRPRCAILIDIIDANNHAPQFLSAPNTTLPSHFRRRFAADGRGEATAALIHHFVARDEDVVVGADVRYQLAEVDGGSTAAVGAALQLNSTTGALSVLDMEALVRLRFPFRLMVRATDCGDAVVEEMLDSGGAANCHLSLQNFTIFADAEAFVGGADTSDASSSTRLAYFDRRHYEVEAVIDDDLVDRPLYTFRRGADGSSDGRTDDNWRDVDFRLFAADETAFRVGRQDGVLRVARPATPHFPLAARYTLTVFVKEAGRGGRYDFAIVDVRLRGGPNDTLATMLSPPPHIAGASCGNVSVPENVAAHNLAQIFASGGSPPLTYHIEGGSAGSADLFSIDTISGVVSCVELDREQRVEHFLVVSAADSRQPKRVDVCTFWIRVLDENDNIPVFDVPQPDLLINASTAVGSVVGRVTAHDADDAANGRVRYRLGADTSGMLDVDAENGEIRFIRDLPFSGNGWTITITAEDSGTKRVLNADAQLRVLWRRRSHRVGVSPTPPVSLTLQRSHYYGVVMESQARQQFVAQVDVVILPVHSRRSRNIVRYALVGGPEEDLPFRIDEFGRVTTTRALDAEWRSLYTLNVTARLATAESLPDELEATCEVVVRVLNINDNTPEFPATLPRTVLPEDTAVGTTIDTIVAVDADGDRMEYALNPLSEHFAISRHTGALFLKRQLDRETADVHQLGVQVYDGEHVTLANYTVHVTDVNDNAPRFSADVVEVRLPYDAVVANVTLHRCVARDADADENGRVRYALCRQRRATTTAGGGKKSSAAQSPFAVDPETGILRTLRQLRANAEYFVEVCAVDGGTPPLESRLIVHIVVSPSTAPSPSVSAADSQLVVVTPPTFKYDIFRFSVNEEHPPFLPFGTVNVLRASTGAAVAVKCHGGFVIVPSPPPLSAPLRLPFGVNRYTGQLFAVGGLDAETRTQYAFRVAIRRVDGCGTGSANATEDAEYVSVANVLVRVNDVNDNAPVFEGEDDDGTLRLNVSEWLKRGTILGRLTAADRDGADNGHVRYRLLSGDVFRMIHVNAASGLVSFDHWKDAFVDDALASLTTDNSTASVSVVFAAEDNGIPARFALRHGTVAVALSEWSGAAPRFPLRLYRKFVQESTTVGTRLFRLMAVNRLTVASRQRWRYSLRHHFTVNANGEEADDEVRHHVLAINESTAEVYLARELDFEALLTDGPLEFTVGVEEESGSDATRRPRSAVAQLQLYVLGVDEFAPVFTKLTYTFQNSADVRIGDRLGRVEATDRDDGVDGRVSYHIPEGEDADAARFVRIDRQSGELFLTRHFTPDNMAGDGTTTVHRLTVAASSGPESRPLTTRTVVYFEFGKITGDESASASDAPDDRHATPTRRRQWYVVPAVNSYAFGALLTVFTLGLCALVALILRIYCKSTCRESPSKVNNSSGAAKPPKKQIYSVSNSMTNASGGGKQFPTITDGPLLLSTRVDRGGGELGGAKMTNYADHFLTLPPPPASPLYQQRLSNANNKVVGASFLGAQSDSVIGGAPPNFCGMLMSGSRTGLRSQPDSGLDHDVISLSSSVITDYLSQGVNLNNNNNDGITAKIIYTTHFRPNTTSINAGLIPPPN